ncbi:phosphotransferase family protein [Streptomyces sp. NPDC048172]|uniref:phosphotransferase family protein n=1 Tax=Streptomyces sp. NPDC048172 TaxID=3365505 RepID=UPI00370FAA64
MRHQPDDLDVRALRSALRGWGIEPERDPAYLPVGFGDHHWHAEDASGAGDGRWFVTVADLTAKPYCGEGTEAAARGLTAAMDTAAALRADRGLGFVLAPVRDRDGRTTVRLGERYALSVFPYEDGESDPDGAPLPPDDRVRALDALAALHRAEPPPRAPAAGPALSRRGLLEETLADLSGPWDGGPFAEPARALFAAHAASLRHRLDAFDALAARVAAAGARPVVTHGEPHSANILRTPGGLRLADWDTVGLAAPERDLWQVAETPADLAHYAEATGHEPDPAALDLYRTRWDLEDMTEYLAWFRAPHTRTPDTEAGWEELTELLG